LAVLAVDPSSSRVGGSILGDKTRMARLANDPGAFVRPSPSAGALGGVAARTRESLLLCEAAGYDVVVVETVGIGQSEAEVAAMTDVFVVLMLPGAGDELQGIKKGVLELADIIAVNKAEGENAARAKAAAAEYRAALQILTPAGAAWRPPVLLISGLAEQGLDTLWEAVLAHRSAMQASGAFTRRRSAQQIRWAWKLVEERMRARLRQSPALRAEIPRIERELAENRLSAAAAADIILRLADFDG
jgi:LAO/AO transport system kinase